jgi:hypothetical protein
VPGYLTGIPAAMRKKDGKSIGISDESGKNG